MIDKVRVAMVAISIGWAGAALAEEDKPQISLPHISVTGSAEKDVKPDYAVLTLGTIDERPAAADAVGDNARHTQDVIADLKAQGVDPKDIRTVRVSLTPLLMEEHDPKTNLVTKRSLTGFRAENLVEVIVRNLDGLGTTVSHVVERGANTYKSLDFHVSDRDGLIDGLRAMAVENAMHRATLYAHGARMKLGRLLAIDPEADRNEGSEADLPMRRSPSSGPQVVALPVEPGVEHLSTLVTATWELVPE